MNSCRRWWKSRPRSLGSKFMPQVYRNLNSNSSSASVRQVPAARYAQPRTARGARTRAALVRGAREVFERDGLVDARIADIAAAAGVATGSFYSYFATKE